jgi:hypothetical protein
MSAERHANSATNYLAVTSLALALLWYIGCVAYSSAGTESKGNDKVPKTLDQTETSQVFDCTLIKY